jgi:hypothetical protein
MDVMERNIRSGENEPFEYGCIEPNQIRLLFLIPAPEHEPL